MKCSWPTPEFCVGNQHNLYSTGSRLGFMSGKTKILGLASGKTQIRGFTLAPRYQHVGIPNAKFWRWGDCPTPSPNAGNFALQWNIGLSVVISRLYIYIAYYLLGEYYLFGRVRITFYINSDHARSFHNAH